MARSRARTFSQRRGAFREDSPFGARLGYRPREAAKLCGCSLDTIRSAIADGSLPSVIVPQVRRGLYGHPAHLGSRAQGNSTRPVVILHNDLCVWWHNYDRMDAVDYGEVLYPLRQVAALLGVSVDTVRAQVKGGSADPLPTRLDGRRYVVAHKDLTAWLERNRRVPARPKG